MYEGLADLSFEAWIDFTFNRELRSDFYPFFEERDAFWSPPPAVGIDYLARLFENSVPLLPNYGDRQIGAALWLLTSENAHFLYSKEVPAAAREHCVEAIGPLFADLFDPRCAPVLGHLDQPGAGPLNAACYMWWENLPFVAAPDDPDRERLNSKVIEVMERILRLDNPACQESALHGLGHLARHISGVDTVITAYLDREGRLPELTTYARAARTGCIL